MLKSSILLRTEAGVHLRGKGAVRAIQEMEFKNFAENMIVLNMLILVPNLWFRFLVKPLLRRNEGSLRAAFKGDGNKAFLMTPCIGSRLAIAVIAAFLIREGHDVLFPVTAPIFNGIMGRWKQQYSGSCDEKRIVVCPDIIKMKALAPAGRFIFTNIQDQASIFFTLNSMRRKPNQAFFLTCVDPSRTKLPVRGYEFLGAQILLPEGMEKLVSMLKSSVYSAVVTLRGSLLDIDVALTRTIGSADAHALVQGAFRSYEPLVIRDPSLLLAFRLPWMWSGLHGGREGEVVFACPDRVRGKRLTLTSGGKILQREGSRWSH
jgi:hypothetical protein